MPPRLIHVSDAYASENIYTSYIRPQLEYGAIIYDNCTIEQSNRLESCQRRAAVACTRAYNRSNTRKLMNEVGWPTLKERRTYSSLLLMYKMIHRQTPEYLHRLLPARLGQHYPTRQNNNFTIIRSNTERHRNSPLPSMIREWNRLDTTLQEKPTLSSFKNTLRDKLFTPKKKLLSQFKGRSAVNQTRMRLGLSALKEQLHSHHIIEDPTCLQCRNEDETIEHYLLVCTRHVGARRVMFQRLGPLVAGLGINFNNINNNTNMRITSVLLSGSEELPYDDNIQIMQIVQDFITASKRF